MTHILIVDDDHELSDMLGQYLGAEGFSVARAFDGDSGAEQALGDHYDAIVLDVMMPGLDGFEVLRRIRARSSVPVLMLTAKGDDIDRIVGLEIGADDYLPKPFNPRELLARLRAILRRAGAQAVQTADDILRLGPLELHPASRSAMAAGKTPDLTGTEFSLPQSLLNHAGQLVSKDQLSQQALGRSPEKYDRSIDMHMSNLRKKLAEHRLGAMIITVRGQGYQLSGEV